MSSREDQEQFAAVEEQLGFRRPEAIVDPSLDRIKPLLDLLGSPQRACPVIHVAGTNGKTTTTRMIDALLRATGLRVGRSTSPHLQTPNERISIDGEPISYRQFVDLYEDVSPYVALIDGQHAVPLSYFEILVAMGFAAFADAPTDVAVIEVGLGGRWDATNTADGVVAVITPISLDHTRYLGDTITKIASEKAGIIKPDAAVVSAAQLPEADEVIKSTVDSVGATLVSEGPDFGVVDRRVAVGGQQLTLRGLSRTYDDVFLPLYGAHHAQNAACALAAVEAFLGATAENRVLTPEIVREAFASVTSPGRLEVLQRNPTILADVAHNPQGMAVTVASVQEGFQFRHLVGVVGILETKDARGILTQLEPLLAEIVVTQNSSASAIPADQLAAMAVEIFGTDRVVVEPRMADALDVAQELVEKASPDSTGGTGILVTGSVMTIGDVKDLLASKQ